MYLSSVITARKHASIMMFDAFLWFPVDVKMEIQDKNQRQRPHWTDDPRLKPLGAALTDCAAYRPVFKDDEPRVKYLRIDEFEVRPRIAGIDRLPASAAKDQRKDHEPESVDEAELHHALYQSDAADGSEWISGLLFEGPDLVRDVALHQAGVLPGKRLLKRA